MPHQALLYFSTSDLLRTFLGDIVAISAVIKHMLFNQLYFINFCKAWVPDQMMNFYLTAIHQIIFGLANPTLDLESRETTSKLLLNNERVDKRVRSLEKNLL